MKKILLLLMTVIMCLVVPCYAQDIMKISMNGEVKRAKELGSGNGISFTLPDLGSNRFIISAVELAVFERRQGDENWHIYKDDAGYESKKKLIENPSSLNIQADFGDVSDYRESAVYKIAYRYHVKSLDDISKTAVAGEATKDGWRLVGEEDAAYATDYGFMFYGNAKPEITLTGIAFDAETINGWETLRRNPSQLETVWLPTEVLQKGITVEYTAEDKDVEDNLIVTYRMIDGTDDTLIAEGVLNSDGKIISDTNVDFVKIVLTVTDNWGASSKSEPVTIRIDKELPQVISHFNDMGRALRGRNLYSKFTLNDGLNELLTSGAVYYSICRDGNTLFRNVPLMKNPSGEYTVDLYGMDDGTYDIMLTVFDKANNRLTHTLVQRLDNTPPVVTFLTQQDNDAVTPYEQWINQSKKIMFTASDTMAGIKNYNCYIDGAFNRSTSYGSIQNQVSVSFDVTSAKTGKLGYRLTIYDNACTVNKQTNVANTSSAGNYVIVSKSVWLDKTPPSITINADETVWYHVPFTITADIFDYPSTTGVYDDSGVNGKYYSVTDLPVPDGNWLPYSDGVIFEAGGIYYLHIKAIDFAGNEVVTTKKIDNNSITRIIDTVTPTYDSKHTVFNQAGGLFVIKNTAYNTKYEFSVEDFDTSDTIRADIRLVSQDDSDNFNEVTVEIAPNGNVYRKAVFNLPYVKTNNTPLPDGVYTMYVALCEIKSDGSILTTEQNRALAEVLIKRNSPPSPVITVDGGNVAIDYPLDNLAESLNRPDIMSLYRKLYKAVKAGTADSNTYKAYADPFAVDDMVVTALYTDPAGNISTATKRIFSQTDSDGGAKRIVTDGNYVTVEESRPATTYYIGIRREKQSGIDKNIFNFMD